MKRKNVSTREFMMSTSGAQSVDTKGVNIEIRPDGTLRVFSGGGGGTRELGITSTTVDDDSYHLIVLNYDGSTGRIWLDKNEEVSNSWDPYDSSENLFFGRRGIRSESYFGGIIDDVLVADSALSSKEIDDYYDSIV
jgi:hypothetical protein